MKKLMKNLGGLIACLLVSSMFAYGYYGLITYVVPFWHDDFRQAMASSVADETDVLLNGAQAAYLRGDLKETSKVLELALDKLVDKGGRYQAKDKWKLERIYFLLGKTYHRQEQFGKAAENYIQTLRLNPNHLPAKYNLESIQNPPGNGGAPGGAQRGGGNEPKI
jgi:tetratricopeptide (TPR) repeat protein